MRIALTLLAAPACFPGPIDLEATSAPDSQTTEETSSETVSDSDDCPTPITPRGHVVVLGTGLIFPTSVVVDRAGRAVAGGAFSQSAILNDDGGSREETIAPELDAAFWSLVPAGAQKPSSTVVVRGALSGSIGSGTHVWTLPSNDTLDVGLVFSLESGSAEIESESDSATIEPGTTPAVIVQRMDSLGHLSGEKIHHGYGDDLKFAGLGSRTGNVVGGFFAYGPRISLEMASGRAVDFEDTSWVDSDIPATLIGPMQSRSDYFGSVREPVFHWPGIFALSLEPLPETARFGVSVLGVVTKDSTIQGLGGELTLSKGNDLYWFELSETGYVTRHAAIVSDALSLITPTHTLRQYLPTHRVRDDGGMIIVLPLRDGLRLGHVATTVIDADHPGLLVAAFDASGNLEWSRRIQWLSGDIAEPYQDAANFMFSDVVVAGDGTVIVGGVLTGELEVDRDAMSTVRVTKSGTDRDGWLVVLSPSGELRHAFDAVVGPGRGAVSGLALGADNELVVVGYFEGPTTFGYEGSAGSIEDVQGSGGFLMRLDGILTCE